MVLRGLLSNSEFQALLQSLTRRRGRKAPAKPAKEKVPTNGGRRKFASVSDAVLAVLRESGEEIRLRDIHVQVENRLGGPVSRYSVADSLRRRCRGRRPLFRRLGYGRYVLLD